MKCPNCGYEAEYQYTGWMEPYLPTIMKMMRAGKDNDEIFEVLIVVHGDDFEKVNRFHSTSATLSYIRHKYNLTPPAIRDDDDKRNKSLFEDYERGGITFDELGEKYGIKRGQVWAIYHKQRRKLEEQKECKAIRATAKTVVDIPIKALRSELSVRTFNCLQNSGCKTVGDVMKMTDAQLLREPNFGRSSLNDWKAYLQRLLSKPIDEAIAS